jgi:transcriptional regulator with XRE-family HTH domain
MQAANLLRYARRRAGLTQRELAERARVPQPAIARIERGVVNPRIDTLGELLKAAGFTIELTPRAGEGVDRSLIRSALAKSPEDRVRAAQAAANNLRTFLAEVGSNAG